MIKAPRDTCWDGSPQPKAATSLNNAQSEDWAKNPAIGEVNSTVTKVQAETAATSLPTLSTRECVQQEIAAILNAVLDGTDSEQIETAWDSHEFTVDWKTIRVRVDVMWLHELARRKVLELLRNLPKRNRPAFKDRELINGKWLNEREFLEKHYWDLISVRGIYRDELTKLDPELSKSLARHYAHGELNAFVPTKSVRLDGVLAALQAQGIEWRHLLALAHAAIRRKAEPGRTG